MMRSSAFFSLVLVLPAFAFPASNDLSKRIGFDFGIPTSWREITTNRTLDNIQDIAKAGMQTMIDYQGNFSSDNIGNLNYWPSGNAWSSIALTDLAAERKDFQGKVLGALGDVVGMYPAFRKNEYNDDTLWWGLAAIYVHRAYGNRDALRWAESTWSELFKYQITGTSGNGKNFTWPDNCFGSTTAGGVFWTLKPDDTYANAITTGLYFALSAQLYEITKDQKYFKTADSARAFIKNHFFDPTDNLIFDGYHITNCALSDSKYNYNIGKYVEGLALLHSATGETSYLDDAYPSAVRGMKTGEWQGVDGVITDGEEQPYDQNSDGRNFKGIFIRGLSELFRRTDHTGYRDLAKAFLNNQANALIELASNDPSSPTKYAVNWHGPMDAGYPHGQLAALDALHAFITVNRP